MVKHGHRRPWAALAAVAMLALGASAQYTVRPGDTLSEVAERRGTSVAALAAANGIANPHRLLAGQTLELPGARHEVQPGETLSGLARRYGVPAERIAALNGLADPHLIRAGATLRIPGAAGSGGTATAAAPPGAPAEVGALIERVSREHGWNPAFVKAVAWQESGWNNAAVSSAGAIGIMQVLPETGERVSRAYGRSLDLRDPEDNVRAGVLFLDELYGLTGRDAELTLAGYFQGLRNVREHGLYPRTERYIANVLALRERFR